MKELSHDNILPFVGASIVRGEVCYVTQYCSRGSVRVSATEFLAAKTLLFYLLYRIVCESYWRAACSLCVNCQIDSYSHCNAIAQNKLQAQILGDLSLFFSAG